MPRKRIYVAYTGGTIGMNADPGAALAPVANYLTNVIDTLPELQGTLGRNTQVDVRVEEYAPLLDSSNMRPENWVAIAEDIERHYDSFDGFVVLHGTDTLAYTSAALSYFIEGTRKPIVITGAQVPFAKPRNDARNNLVSAVEVAATMPEGLAQVCVVFGSRVMRGNRVTKVSALAFDAFASPRFPLLGTVGIDIQFDGTRWLRKSVEDFRIHRTRLPVDAVAAVRLFPGFRGDIIRSLAASGELRGLVIEAYGSGNGPVGDADFVAAIREVRRDQNVVVVVVAQPLEAVVNLGAYETGKALSRAGAISGRDLTTEAALAKLYYFISLGFSGSELESKMRSPLAGDMTE